MLSNLYVSWQRAKAEEEWKRLGKVTSAFDKQVGGNHYKNFKIEPLEFCQVNKLDYCESNVIKYVCRWKHKGDPIENLDKAIHNLELLKELYLSGKLEG